MGLPLGAGLSTYFLAYEQGIPFLLQAIPWGILGLSSSLLFALAYYLADRFFPHPLRLVSTLRSSLVAILAYGVASMGLRLLPLRLGIALPVTLGVIFLNFLAVRWIIPPSIKPPKTRLSPPLILLRGLITAVTIASLTGMARMIGPAWSGVLSAFPIVLFQVLVFLHVEEGPKAVSYTHLTLPTIYSV